MSLHSPHVDRPLPLTYVLFTKIDYKFWPVCLLHNQILEFISGTGPRNRNLVGSPASDIEKGHSEVSLWNSAVPESTGSAAKCIWLYSGVLSICDDKDIVSLHRIRSVPATFLRFQSRSHFNFFRQVLLYFLHNNIFVL